MKEQKQSNITLPRTLASNKEKFGMSIIDNRSKSTSYKALIHSLNDGTPIQRLNSISAKTASDAAVNEINNKKLGSELLSGWGKSTPGHAGHRFTTTDRDRVNEIGDDTGCCICFSKDPGTTQYRYNLSGKFVGNFIPDHEPPNSLVSGGYTGAIKFYPHCLLHSNLQAAVVAEYKKQMKIIRAATDSDWATGVDGRWFWN